MRRRSQNALMKKSFTRVNNHFQSCDMLSLLSVIRAHIALFNCINCKKLRRKRKYIIRNCMIVLRNNSRDRVPPQKKFFFPFVILKLIYQSQSEVKVKRNFPKTFQLLRWLETTNNRLVIQSVGDSIFNPVLPTKLSSHNSMTRKNCRRIRG